MVAHPNSATNRCSPLSSHAIPATFARAYFPDLPTTALLSSDLTTEKPESSLTTIVPRFPVTQPSSRDEVAMPKIAVFVGGSAIMKKGP